MTIPFRIKKLTETAKVPTQENEGGLWDLYGDNFCIMSLSDFKEDEKDSGSCLSKDKSYCLTNNQYIYNAKDDLILENLDIFNIYASAIYTDTETFNIEGFKLHPQGRILVKTGIAIELPAKPPIHFGYDWIYSKDDIKDFDRALEYGDFKIDAYAIADIRPRLDLALKHGITILNTPSTIDNSYRKEIGVILYNAGHEPYTINKGDKIAQMLIKPLYPSSMQVVKGFEDSTEVKNENN